MDRDVGDIGEGEKARGVVGRGQGVGEKGDDVGLRGKDDGVGGGWYMGLGYGVWDIGMSRGSMTLLGGGCY
ncbi:hypothetical protein, partial [Neisseria sicca]|uniref:hypothetical protein n=1 Tax=Neisseria sicca TaxID=490 RepID=UPI001C991B15